MWKSPSPVKILNGKLVLAVLEKKINFKVSMATFGWTQSQQDNNGMDYKNVHRSGLPCSPAQKHLVLRFRLENTQQSMKSQNKPTVSACLCTVFIKQKIREGLNVNV